MRHVRITLGYDGTDFHGSQLQSGVRTVQGELERLIEQIAPGSTRTIFAGRTDRGVHAIGQVVSVSVNWCGSNERLRDALNALSPDDLVIRQVEAVEPGFHARYDARWREYRYRIVIGDVPPVLERRFIWWRRSAVDPIRASDACRAFIGEHAFGTFAGSGWSQRREVHTLMRVIRDCDWRVSRDGRRHELRTVANGFLPHMVRNMVAAIVPVGTGEKPANWINELINANDRRALGEAAPPQGLVLWGVEYADGDAGRDDSMGIVALDEGYGRE